MVEVLPRFLFKIPYGYGESGKLGTICQETAGQKAILDTTGASCRGHNRLLRAWQGGDTRIGQRNGDSSKTSSEWISANIIEKEDTAPDKPVVQGKQSPFTAATLSSDLGQSPGQKVSVAPPGASEILERTPEEPNDIPSPAKIPGYGASWQQEYSQLINEIHLRHYSPKTLKSYQSNVRKFQDFTRSKPPESLTTDDVKEFLTFLAVKKQVAASTQNLAFNSLLFFYRHILHKEFGTVNGVVRAKKRPHIPVVLSREEIDMVLQHLEPPYDLIVKLLYGCGLRLFECMGLRVQCLNFDAGIITVHDGKGQKDRTVPMPQSIMPELRIQLATLKELHREDQRKEYAGVFLVNALEKKYKNAAREFIWQWLFPAKQLTRENGTGELRRYHLYVTHVQKAIKRAADDAGVCKRVTAHTFRHSFASHLLQNNFDIRTIQELLGHSDVRTTMIYTHTVKSVTLKEVRSPLDF